MSDTFRYEPMVCIRVKGGDIYHLRGVPTERQKLRNKINQLADVSSNGNNYFVEAYDTRGNLHYININYIIDIYIDEKAYLKKEETR